MDKVLIIVEVPMIDSRFEVFVPINKKVGALKILLVEGINQILNCNLQSPVGFHIHNKENCNVYDENKTVLENNIDNSTEVILI